IVMDDRTTTWRRPDLMNVRTRRKRVVAPHLAGWLKGIEATDNRIIDPAGLCLGTNRYHRPTRRRCVLLHLVVAEQPRDRAGRPDRSAVRRVLQPGFGADYQAVVV